MKRIVVLLIVVILAGLLGWAVHKKIQERNAAAQGGGPKRSAAPVAVEVIEARKGSIRDVRTFTGSLYANSRFIVAPKVDGRLEQILVDIGDEVHSGDLIARIDDAEYVEEVERARAELNVARANVQEAVSNLETARRELNRVESLRRKEIATDQNLDTARAEFQAQEARHKVAVARVSSMESELNSAQLRLAYTRIHAQWADKEKVRIVGERFVDQGAMLKANAEIASIIDLNTMTGVINVIERDYPLLKIGQIAYITTDASPGRTFEGKIARIAPLLRETSRQARVEISIANPDGQLKPGMFIRARIEFGFHENAILVPPDAITRRENKRGIFLVDKDAKTARFVPVEIGIEQEDAVEILQPEISGLVVTLGQHLLSEGAAVRLPEAKPSAEGAKKTAAPGAKPSDNQAAR